MASLKIYSTSTSPYGIILKEFLKERHIEFEDIDIGTDRQKEVEMIIKSGQTAHPVTDLNGKIIVGCDRYRISKELELYLQQT
ncbi:MAG: glutaredoxin domain-containing protein [bacterium]